MPLAGRKWTLELVMDNFKRRGEYYRIDRLNYKQDNHMRYLIYINDNAMVNHDTKKNYFINSWQDNSHSILDHFVDGNFHTFLQLCAGPGESQTDLVQKCSVLERHLPKWGANDSTGGGSAYNVVDDAS